MCTVGASRSDKITSSSSSPDRLSRACSSAGLGLTCTCASTARSRSTPSACRSTGATTGPSATTYGSTSVGRPSF